MNRIYWENEYISAFTDLPCADIHKHWMLQLFLCLYTKVQVEINGEKILDHCIILDSNVKHRFCVKGDVYYTMLIEPTSDIAFYMRDHYINKTKGYGFIDVSKHKKTDFLYLLTNVAIEEYKKFIEEFNSTIFITNIDKKSLDVRVREIIEQLEQSDFFNVSVKVLADKVSLSESRITHLFKEYTGIPLKGYILMKKWKKAYELILKNGNITTAALDAGFDSPSHFASTNKKLTGMTAQFTFKNSRFLKV
ncbi:helix-turn-helix transcriptional regulator [Anaerocolumna sp. MB42-C2]|uniref:helix-turn-helix transcriptional regulator n=1 Tax=Anaerocolumna sp. MB42-C2 TaxID=3070997 RepID=UPI0027E020E4|nr:helix-turn-helix transcriptional regulator [Anaerocolumna sp. MB42-C2]WMJ89116.1 helix-turn-helix transcriptional regulator [Anaerocolumna sp. MB42-C2]